MIQPPSITGNALSRVDIDALPAAARYALFREVARSVAGLAVSTLCDEVGVSDRFLRRVVRDQADTSRPLCVKILGVIGPAAEPFLRDQLQQLAADARVAYPDMLEAVVSPSPSAAGAAAEAAILGALGPGRPNRRGKRLEDYLRGRSLLRGRAAA